MAAEPLWIAPTVVLQIHELSIDVHGGSAGIRDAGLLESALERPKNLWKYTEPKPDVAALAAALAHGVVKNHPFVDGNKRTAWVVGRLLLRINGADVVASHDTKTEAMLALAAGGWSEQQFADWLRSHTRSVGEA